MFTPVDVFVECEGGSKNGEALMKLGKLMYESHDSCAKNYDCSHPALDQMVQLSDMYGALGARVSQSRYNLFEHLSCQDVPASFLVEKP